MGAPPTGPAPSPFESASGAAAPPPQPEAQQPLQQPADAPPPPPSGYQPPPAAPFATAPPGAYAIPPPPPGVPVVHLFPAPVPGVGMRPPAVPPGPGQVLLGYEMYKPLGGCCQCEGLSAAGLMSVILLVLLFWPLAWVPCVMPECYEPLQRPVYGFPAPGYGPPPAQGVPMQQQAAPAGYPPV